MTTVEQTRSVAPAQGLLTAVSSVLRGISQVFLQDHAVAGAIIVVALAMASPRLALLAVLGSAVQSALGALDGRGEEARHGLMGYNGALVGAACSLDLPSLQGAVLATIVGAAACVPLHQAFRRLFEWGPLARFELPVATAPFCTIAGLIHVVVHVLSVPGHLEATEDPVRATWAGALNALSEVFLADGWASGAGVLVALLIASWRVGVWAAVGSVLAVAAGWAVSADLDSLSTGLLGYSAVLTAIALGCTFINHLPLWVRAVAVGVGVLLAVGFRALLLATPIPVYTWPFLLTTWTMLIVLRWSHRPTHS